jgi:hypothetical protein
MNVTYTPCQNTWPSQPAPAAPVTREVMPGMTYDTGTYIVTDLAGHYVGNTPDRTVANRWYWRDIAAGYAPGTAPMTRAQAREAAEIAFAAAIAEAHAANKEFEANPDGTRAVRAHILNRTAERAAYAAHDAREHGSGPCDCYARRHAGARW